MASKIKVKDVIGIYESLKRGDPSASFPDIWIKVKEKFMRVAKKRNISDPGQSWKTASGKAFEQITIIHISRIVSKKIFKEKNISAESWYKLSPEQKTRLSYELVRKCTDDRINVSNEPDIVIFKENRPKVLVSCKSSLRDRVNMDLFWALEYKRRGYVFTLVCAETSKEIGTCKEPKKPRALAESIYDRLYIVNGDVEYCEVVRPFSDIGEDLKKWLF